MGRLKSDGKLPAHFQLLLAGKIPSGRPAKEIDQLVAAHGLRDNVRQLGVVTDMQSLYWASNLVLMPSQTEGSSLAAFEAMSAGLPVLASNRGNSDGAVVDGVHGWEVPANDLGALERAIERLSRCRRRCYAGSGRPGARASRVSSPRSASRAISRRCTNRWWPEFDARVAVAAI